MRGSRKSFTKYLGYFALVYWLVFVVYTFWVAQFSTGLAQHSEHIPYPLNEALLVCVILGIQMGLTYLILKSPVSLWVKTGLATVFSFFVALCSIFTLGPDVPGYAVVWALFSIANTVLLLLVTLIFGAINARSYLNVSNQLP